VSPSQSLVYTYDVRNRLETVTRTIDGAPPQLTRYAYDAAGNRREMVGADGTRTEYAYDARHRLVSLIKRVARTGRELGHPQFSDLLPADEQKPGHRSRTGTPTILRSPTS